MTRATRSTIAAERRRIAVDMRLAGHTWVAIGAHLGVTASRAYQIAKPCVKRRAGRPQSVEPKRSRMTLHEYIEAAARRVDECAAAVAKVVGR